MYRKKHSQNTKAKDNKKKLTKDDFYKAASYMSMGCWQLPPGSFPFGNWYLF